MVYSLWSRLCVTALYPLLLCGLIACYHQGLFLQSFSAACFLLVVGVLITFTSMRRYRQRLNYVEGLDRDVTAALEGQDQVKQTAALQAHWIDLLGDRGVGLVSVLLLILVIPVILASASHLAPLHVFEVTSTQHQQLGLLTWIAFVAIETVGAVKLIFDYFGMEQLQDIAHLGDNFTAYWQWFMALVQVGLISLVFDVFRRYLDLSSTLNRLASVALIATDELTERETALRSHPDGTNGDRIERGLLNDYKNSQSQLQARVDTLARFLCVFPKRRMINRLVQSILSSEQQSFQTKLSEEGKQQLLNALLVSGARMEHRGLAARVSFSLALKLLQTRSTSLPLRRAALDILGGYHPLTTQLPAVLIGPDLIQSLSVSRDQLRAGSAHAISQELSIDYERLILASSYALVARGERSALSALFMTRYSDDPLLRQEGEHRLNHLLLQLSQSELGILEVVIALLNASEAGDSVDVEKQLHVLTLMHQDNPTETADLLDLNLCQLIMSHLTRTARSPSTLRTMVDHLSQLNLPYFDLAIWAALQSDGASQHLSGLIEGLKSQPACYLNVAKRIVFTLREGSPQEVKRQLVVCKEYADPDSSSFITLIMESIDALQDRYTSLHDQGKSTKQISHQLFHLISGLAVSQAASHHAQVSEWLNQRDRSSLPDRPQQALKLVKAQLGEAHEFLQLFVSYLDQLASSPSDRAKDPSTQLIHTLDPEIKSVERSWFSLLLEAREARPARFQTRARDVIEMLQEHISPVRFAWLSFLLAQDVDSSLRSHLLQLLRRRLKHLNYGTLNPLSAQPVMAWLYDRVLEQSSSEQNPNVLAQWVRVFGAISPFLDPSDRHERTLNHLFLILDRGLPSAKINAQVTGVAAETIGVLGKTCQLDVSQQLIQRFAEGSVALKTGICKALLEVSDPVALQFFSEQAVPETPLNNDGFNYMVKALHQARNLTALIPLLSGAELLSDSKLSALISPFKQSSYPSGALVTLLEDHDLNTLRVHICERLQHEDLIAPCAGIIPLLFDENDQQLELEDSDVARALFEAIQRSELRPIDCLHISRALAITFPKRFSKQFDTIVSQLKKDGSRTLPQWILGLETIDPDQMVSLIFDLLQTEEELQPNSIVHLSGPLVRHGGSRGRQVVYQWISEYPMVGYSIVNKIKEYGSPEQDKFRLKDELYRTRRLLDRFSLESEPNQQQTAYATSLQISLLNTLYHFGEKNCFAELVQLSIYEANNMIERQLQTQALDHLPNSVREILTAELEE